MAAGRGTTREVRYIATEMPGDRVPALAAGDRAERERAWRQLFETQHRRVYRLVVRYGVEPSEAEDLVQRTFVIAIRRLPHAGELRDPGAWLRGIAVRVVASHRRWRKVRRAKRWLLHDTDRAARAPVVTPEHHTAAAEEAAAARAVLAQMSGKLRDVLVLCDIQECQPAEAAAILGIPVNTVRSRRRLARQKFLSLWSERGEELR